LAIGLTLFPFAGRERMNIPAGPHALTKRCFQTGWSIVFSQEIPECFIGKGLEINFPVAGEQSDR
jgi:hypothetical protein